ncbi:MAG: hypothetical protein U0990_00965 [Candidatus Nanopelagicales bacterium]|nr:hypothetical protein [Candidatus Nanopelagicales bacterium]
MPLSKKRDRLRKRKLRAKQRPNRLSKKDVRVLRRAGLDPEEVVGDPSSEKVSVRVTNAIVRALEAKTQIIDQGYKFTLRRMQAELDTLKASLATDPGILALQRIAQMEADQALRDANYEREGEGSEWHT